jgi:hypothetical protein
LTTQRIANTVYPNRHGYPLVLAWGEVENPTAESKHRVTVTGELLSAEGQVVAEFTAPAGITFQPHELFSLEDRRAVEAAYRDRVPGLEGKDLPAGKSMPFMLVMYDHPTRYDDLRLRTRAGETDSPTFGLPPAPEQQVGPPAPPGADAPAAEEPKTDPPLAKPGAAPAKAVPAREEVKGTIVRLKPAPGGGKQPAPEVVEEPDVEVVEEPGAETP